MKEVLSSSETSVLTTATRHNIPEDVILHSENLNFYTGKIFAHHSDFVLHPNNLYMLNFQELLGAYDGMCEKGLKVNTTEQIQC
jgi:hypothetical protein